LRSLVEAGFAKRIMFGSDFPDQVGAGIDAILTAEFLTSDQKSDILATTRLVSYVLSRRRAIRERPRLYST
jgi:hypothetical protein